MGYRLISSDEYLAHHGILGMKWGVRRFQNKDGSLTEEGKKRYNNYVDRLTNVTSKYGNDRDIIRKPSLREKVNKELDAEKVKYHEELVSDIGLDNYNRIQKTMKSVYNNIESGNLDDYKGEYKKTLKQSKKDYEKLESQLTKHFQKVEKEAKAIYNEENSRLSSLLPKGKREIRDIISDMNERYFSSPEGSSLRERRNRATSEYMAKAQLASNDWVDRTIASVVKSVPKDKQGSVYELINFDSVSDLKRKYTYLPNTI